MGFSPSFQSSSSTRDLRKCLRAILTNLHPCMCLAARKGYVCSRKTSFCYLVILQGCREKRTEWLMWHLTFPLRAWAKSMKFLRSSVHISRKAHLRWVEGEIHEALSTCHVRTLPSPVESDSDLVFSGSYNVNQLYHSRVNWGMVLVLGSTMKNELAPGTSGTLRRPGQTLPKRDVGNSTKWQNSN